MNQDHTFSPGAVLSRIACARHPPLTPPSQGGKGKGKRPIFPPFARWGKEKAIDPFSPPREGGVGGVCFGRGHRVDKSRAKIALDGSLAASPHAGSWHSWPSLTRPPAPKCSPKRQRQPATRCGQWRSRRLTGASSSGKCGARCGQVWRGTNKLRPLTAFAGGA